MSGTGLFACQLAKHVFKAGKVITTVSTAKVPKVPELLGEGTVDQSKLSNFPSSAYIPIIPVLTQTSVIDYTKSDPRDIIEKGSVDFLFDTAGLSMQYLCLMKPKTGHIVTISTTPSAETLQHSSLMRLSHKPTIPIYVRFALNLMDSGRNFRAGRYGIKYEYLILEGNGKELDELASYVEEGKLRTVVGTTVDLSDLDAVRKACQVVYDGKGGLGKMVVRIPQADNDS